MALIVTYSNNELFEVLTVLLRFALSITNGSSTKSSSFEVCKLISFLNK